MDPKIFSIIASALERVASLEKTSREWRIPSTTDQKVLANLQKSVKYKNCVKEHFINEEEMIMNMSNDTNVVQEEFAKLSALDIKELKRLWQEKTGVDAPQHARRRTLVDRMLYLFQERLFGGLSIADKRKLEDAKKLVEKGEPLFENPKKDELIPGMILTREHGGRKHSVKILENDKVEYNCKIYNSLSAVAREITGARWNGREFFRLIRR
jgi:hypothetical protein